ncbi:CBS domain-containing protein [Halohasta salina]|uniref:CBS domain-containing protein n=1 Tax=Halohasta salina TaxID=2961621 RepID=UPI0020A48088|nr:CBS domain-containing protein [Halohasta salina]
MNREFVGVSESDSLAEAAELMRAEGATAVVVLRGSEPIGTLSPAGAMAAMLDADPESTTVGEVMAPPVPTTDPSTPLSVAAQQLVSQGVSHLLVVDEGAAVGLVTDREVLAASGTTPADEAPAPAAEASTERTAEPEPAPADESVQSICEVCGSLAPELSTVNGQAVCADCRAH